MLTESPSRVSTADGIFYTNLKQKIVTFKVLHVFFKNLILWPKLKKCN